MSSASQAGTRSSYIRASLYGPPASTWQESPIDAGAASLVRCHACGHPAGGFPWVDQGTPRSAVASATLVNASTKAASRRLMTLSLARFDTAS